MTAVDDLHVGQWVAITYHNVPNMMGHPFMQHGPVLDGRPLQIRAISLPFVCVSDGLSKFAIDIRDVSVQLLNKKYVALMGYKLTSDQVRSEDASWLLEESVPGGNMAPEEDQGSADEGLCPVCGSYLVEMLINATRKWVLSCKECGFSGILPSDMDGSGAEND